MAFDKCKLCLQKKLLIKQSHIIPNFMYKGIFDDGHKMILANLKKTGRQDKVAQTGYWDKHILCHECENKNFGELDRYASSVIFGDLRLTNIKKEIVTADGIKLLKVSNLAPLKFKLFILSILWRAHVSKQSFFKNIDLGDVEAEKLREILLPESKVDASEYQISILGVIGANRLPSRMIIDPYYQSGSAGNFAMFYINGFLYTINIGSNKYSEIYKTFSLTDNGELKIPLLQGVLARTILKSLNLPDYIINYFTP